MHIYMQEEMRKKTALQQGKDTMQKSRRLWKAGRWAKIITNNCYKRDKCNYMHIKAKKWKKYVYDSEPPLNLL